ncbi:MAG: RAD55 family ATPase [Thermoplasmatota archaeon]
MNDVELYGSLIKEFIRKMTSPEIGQFRMEVSTFRIILERARVKSTKLIKFAITENGKVVNDLEDEIGSIIALETFLRMSVEFISSLIGEELSRDIISKNLKGSLKDLCEMMRGRQQLIKHLPAPFNMLVKETLVSSKVENDHEEVLGLFEDIFQAYLKELSGRTDLSAFKLKLSILREKHRLLKHVSITRNNILDLDRDIWATASDEEVRDSLVAAFNSMVGRSTFLVGKEEAVKKASRIFLYYFEGKERIMERYGMEDLILEGALHKRISTGFLPLDDRMGGGITKGSSVLFISPSGIERDIFISQLLSKRLKDGSSVLMVLSREPPRSIRMLLRSRGMDADTFEEVGNLKIVDWFSWRGERIIGVERDGHSLRSSKILSNLGIAINKGLRELAYSTSKIALVHMIAPALNIFEFTQVYNFIQRLRAKFKEEDIAAVFFLEKDALGSERLSRIMEVFDGVVEMSKDLSSGRVRREISVLTMSGVDFDATPEPFLVRENMLVPLDGVGEEKENGKYGSSRGKEPDAGKVHRIKAGPQSVKFCRTEDQRTTIRGPEDTDNKVFRKKFVRKRKGAPLPDKVVEVPLKHPKVPANVSGKQAETRDIVGVVKPKRVRVLRNKLQEDTENGRHNRTSEKFRSEDILKEAISTIEDLLDSSKPNMEDYKRYVLERRIK